MGHGMAKNIRQKIPANNTLIIYDINVEAMKQFISDYGRESNVWAASSPREVAEHAVRSAASRPVTVIEYPADWRLLWYHRILL